MLPQIAPRRVWMGGMRIAKTAAYWARTAAQSFLGHAPAWYKGALLVALAANPLILLTLGPVAAGWSLLAEFIIALAMSLSAFRCNPEECSPWKPSASDSRMRRAFLCLLTSGIAPLVRLGYGRMRWMALPMRSSRPWWPGPPSYSWAEGELRG